MNETGAIAAMVANLKIEVIRTENREEGRGKREEGRGKMNMYRISKFPNFLTI
ncbi:MAG: hypothetical protein V1733_01645 [bacterium]